MKLKLFCSMLLLFSVLQSCKKAEQLKDELVDTYWKNTEDVVIQFNEDEAYVIDAGNSDLDSKPSVFDINTMPYIKGIIKSGENQWSGEIVHVNRNNGVISSITYQNTTIALAKENDKLVIRFSNADASAGTWTEVSAGTGGTGGTPVVHDTTTTVTIDTSNTCSTDFAPTTSSGSVYRGFPIRSGWRMLSYVQNGYYYRMDATLYAGGQQVILYFKEKPTTSKVYKVVSGATATMTGVGADEVGVTCNAYNQGESGTVSITANASSVIATATNIKTSKLTGADLYLTFKFNAK